MNLASCKDCGLVIDLDKVKFIHTELPDYPEDEKRRGLDGELNHKIDCHYNPDIVWQDQGPLDTWQCPICKEFNGKGEEE